MNTALLEELVRRKAQSLRTEGISISEALDLAGEEILNCFGEVNGHGSRFCLRMWLQGAKKRISPERMNQPNNPEGDKVCFLSRDLCSL